MAGRLLVGTSGWSYDWPRFYPRKLASRRRLLHYGERFATVEVNYSFYHLPRSSTYEKWVQETPEGFLFALKASRFVTHAKRLSGVKLAWRKYLQHALVLGPKLGPVLLQLPPGFHADAKRLGRFLEIHDAVRGELQAEALRLAVEVRHRGWFEDRESLAALERHGAALVPTMRCTAMPSTTPRGSPRWPSSVASRPAPAYR